MKYVNSTGCKGKYAFLNCNTGKAFLTPLGKRCIVPTQMQGPPPLTVCLSRKSSPSGRTSSVLSNLKELLFNTSLRAKTEPRSKTGSIK